ncbi:hypothetical protein V6N12_039311 [Hibiscus sabdariffa]|uniref:Uncharacterized protein n=1 Tax=Hibiscus sabdariffa TaxID=183260 RepID=A0ABR2E0B2_9ROSI
MTKKDTFTSMDRYAGKRAVTGLVPGRGSSLILKDHVNFREQNAQFCSRIGCSRRVNSVKGTPNCYSEKSKSSRPSSSEKEIIGSSSGVCRAVSNTRKPSTNLLRKLPSQLEIDSSETSSVEEEPEVLELVSPSGKIQRGLQPYSEDDDIREITMMEVGSSSLASNTRQRRSFTRSSGLGYQDTLVSPSVTLASRSAFRATQSNTSKYGLRNPRFSVVSSGCSSSGSSLSKGKNTVKKSNSEGEGSSSTRGKKLSGSSLEGLNNSSSLGVSISDSRQARNWSSNRDCGITSSFRTQRSSSSYSRGRPHNQANGNSLILNESPLVIPQAPQSDIHIDLNAPVSTETASTRASSYNRPGSESLHSVMPSSSSEVGICHSSVNSGRFQRYNMDGLAEVLLALERVEQDAELTYEQLLVLETGLLLDGLNFYDQHRNMRLDIDNMSYEELLALEERMGTVSTAIPEEALTKCLKKGIYETSLEDANVSFKGEVDDIKCSICQEEYAIGDDVGRLHFVKSTNQRGALRSAPEFIPPSSKFVRNGFGSNLQRKQESKAVTRGIRLIELSKISFARFSNLKAYLKPLAMGENFMQEEDIRLETTRARFANVVKRHAQLTERLSRDSDKMIFERLQKEFEAARASQSQEIILDGDQWNDGLLATIREQVHMEADRKAASGDANNIPTPHLQEKVTYRVGNKVICCLEGTRIGILYETSFAGEPCELYHCVLESKSFLEKMTVIEHTIPFFLPLREVENDLLSSNAMRFIDHIGELLQAYVDRREQVRLVKELYGNQIGELYHSLPYHMIEFALDDSDCKVTIGLRYPDLVSVLPTRVKVLAWPMHQFKKNHTSSAGAMGPQPIPARLSYAEDALRTMSLPEAYAEIVLNLPQALQQIFWVGNPS